MPTWNEIDAEISNSAEADICDQVRKKYLGLYQEQTGRTVIAYYSAFLQKRADTGGIHPECAITDLDMNGLMATVHDVDRKKGLDLIIHTPGGGIEATRSIVEYLYKMFGKDIRVAVPHMAMSAGTMIATAAREIILSKHSCLGPTDPQVKGHPAMGVLAEVDRAIEEIKEEPLKQLVWSAVFNKYPPAFILDCERQLDGSRKMVSAWLENNMFDGDKNKGVRVDKIVNGLLDYSGTTEHSHHFLIDKCIDLGLKINSLENDQDLQEALLSVHHSFVASFARTNAIKIIENGNGGNWIISA